MKIIVGMTENKKVKNAKKHSMDGLSFRSGLEQSCYKKLVEAGFNPNYEKEKFTLFEGFKPRKNILRWLPIYKKKKIVGYDRNENKVQAITYTPDFTFEHNGYKIIIEVKGNPNDAYPNKRKMFFRVLEDMDEEQNFIFFEPHNVAQISETIEIIKSL